MKALKIQILITAMIALVVTACHKDNDSTTGSMTVRMTDAPANFTAVNVEVLSVEVHYDSVFPGSGSWQTLNTNAGIYNLLELQDSVSVVLANSTLPVGHLTQMRLILGDSNTVEIDSTMVHDLATPSAQQTGLKFNVNADIKAGGKTELLLDFDAGKSVVEKGNGTFSLKPVITVKDILYL